MRLGVLTAAVLAASVSAVAASGSAQEQGDARAPSPDPTAGAAPGAPSAPAADAPPPPAQEPPSRAPRPAPAPEPPKPPPEPLKRQRFDAAIMQGVDKITAETLRFEVKVGEPVRYRGLILTVHACENTAPDEAVSDAFAHLEVLSQPVSGPGRAAGPPRLVFRGWMSAQSPSLHPLEHPIYDLWLIACKSSAPAA